MKAGKIARRHEDFHVGGLFFSLRQPQNNKGERRKVLCLNKTKYILTYVDFNIFQLFTTPKKKKSIKNGGKACGRGKSVVILQPQTGNDASRSGSEERTLTTMPQDKTGRREIGSGHTDRDKEDRNERNDLRQRLQQEKPRSGTHPAEKTNKTGVLRDPERSRK